MNKAIKLSRREIFLLKVILSRFIQIEEPRALYKAELRFITSLLKRLETEI